MLGGDGINGHYIIWTHTSFSQICHLHRQSGTTHRPWAIPLHISQSDVHCTHTRPIHSITRHFLPYQSLWLPIFIVYFTALYLYPKNLLFGHFITLDWRHFIKIEMTLDECVFLANYNNICIFSCLFYL